LVPALPISPRRIGVIAGIVILILMVVEFNARLEERNRLSEERDRIRIEATQSMTTQIALQTQVALAASDQAAEAWARSDGNYIRPGDHPVVPLGQPGSTPVSVPSPTPMPTPLPNWQVWWNLFFSE
jgi:hypothetical protein